jgi:hypothetical protein
MSFAKYILPALAASQVAFAASCKLINSSSSSAKKIKSNTSAEN